MSPPGPQEGEWSEWAWNPQIQQYVRYKQYRNGSIRRQYGEMPTPAEEPRYPGPAAQEQPQFTRPSFEIQQPPQNYEYMQPAPPRWSAPLSAPSVPFSNFGSGSGGQSDDLYDAEDAQSNTVVDPPLPPQLASRPSYSEQEAYGSNNRTRPQASAQPQPQTQSAADQSSRVVVRQGERSRSDDSPNEPDESRRLPDNLEEGFSKLSVGKGRRYSNNYHLKPRPNPQRRDSKESSHTQDSRSESKTAHSRRSEKRTEPNDSSQAKNQKSIPPITAPRYTNNAGNQRNRRNSSVQAERSLVSNIQNDSSGFTPPPEQQLIKKTYPNPPPPGVPEPNRSNTAVLDSKFRTFSSRHFSLGKVFMILWSEPLGANSEASYDEFHHDIPAKYNETAYHSIRRFIIAQTREGHCTCLPIFTYGGKGTTKRGVKPNDHAIVYTGDTVPNLLPGEKALRKSPIRIVETSTWGGLKPASRINYSKVYTIEHNYKVCFIGKIHEDSEGEFFAQYRNSQALDK